MIDGVTIYTTDLLSGGAYYPPGDIELVSRLIVPPQSGMEQQGSTEPLPLYDLFSESADEIGVNVAVLYIMATLSISMGLGFLFFLVSGSVFAAVLAMTVLLAGFFSTGVMPFWILIFFVAFSFGIIYLYRQA